MAEDVTWKPNRKVLNRLTQAQKTALLQTAEALHTRVVQAQVVPRMDGDLQGKAFFVDDSGASSGEVSLVHNTPYARRLYFHPEYHFHLGPWVETVKHRDGSVSELRHDGNPNARGEWFEDWLPGGKEQDYAAKVYAKRYKELSGI